MNEPLYTGKGTSFYVAADHVADTVNLAVRLNRPILVEGEPGCGKTMLAYSIAAEKNLDEPIKIAVKSTSRAQDLLYRIDSLRRLQDAQSPHNSRAQFIYPYLSLGLLGQAIHQERRCVVLIDEIDKADIDFPNDLLDVLDRFFFQIDALPPEEEEACRQEKGFGRIIATSEAAQPIVVITSNREKRLPEPFLRRCLYLRLLFPQTPAELSDIVRKNIKQGAEEIDQNLLERAIEVFRGVRAVAIAGDMQKPPTTSELIDWVRILYWKGATIDSLTKDASFPPYWELLFKSMSDLDNYPALARSKRV